MKRKSTIRKVSDPELRRLLHIQRRLELEIMAMQRELERMVGARVSLRKKLERETDVL